MYYVTRSIIGKVKNRALVSRRIARVGKNERMSDNANVFSTFLRSWSWVLDREHRVFSAGNSRAHRAPLFVHKSIGL